VLAAGVVLAKQMLPTTPILAPPLYFYGVIAAVGVALGFAGSILSAMRFISRVH